MRQCLKGKTIIYLSFLILLVSTASAWNFEGTAVTIISPLESNGALPVNIQDQTTQIIDLHTHLNIANITLAVNTSIDNTSVIINQNASVAVGQVICFKENGRYTQAEILSIATDTPVVGQDTLTFDTPLDYAYTTNAEDIHVGNFNLNVDGSVTPQIFHISPPTNVDWDVVRMIVQIEDTVSMDSGKFGGLNALTNGVVIRKKNQVYENIFNVKTNGDFSAHAYDVNYDDKAPAGVYGIRVRRTFGGQSKNGVVVRLEGNLDDEFQLIIQDDLTGLTKFHVILQGHVVTD